MTDLSYAFGPRGSVVRSDGAHIPTDPSNADRRDFDAWVAAGGVAAPWAPPFDAAGVEAECGRRIYAVASDNAQKNMLANIVANAMSAEDKETFDSGVAWIASMQAVCRALIAAEDDTFADDAHWPAVPAGVAALADRF